MGGWRRRKEILGDAARGLRTAGLALLLVAPLQAYLDLVTASGEIWRTHNGTTWARIAQLGGGEPVGYLTKPGSYILLRDGQLLSSSNAGTTWVSVHAYPFLDGVALRYDNVQAQFFALTRSGVVYRGTSVGGMVPVGQVPLNDAVDLWIRSGVPSSIWVMGARGDVYRSTDQGATWQGMGNVGSGSVVAMTGVGDTLYALTWYGDVVRSVDSGRTWTGWKVLSQLGAVDLQTGGSGELYAVTDAGDLAMYQWNPGNWQWVGTLSQLGVRVMATGGLVTFEAEGTGTPRKPQVRLRYIAGEVWMEGAPPGAHYEVWTVNGRHVCTGKVTGSRMHLSCPVRVRGILRVGSWRFPLIGK